MAKTENLFKVNYITYFSAFLHNDIAKKQTNISTILI